MGEFSHSFELKTGPGRLPSLLPAKDGQRDGRRLASVFTRPADTQAERLPVLVPLTKFIENSKTSASPARASAEPQSLSPSETKPKRKKRKRIRPKTERRREQCRNNQARYRDRQRGFVRELEESVYDLYEEIQELTKERHTLCYGIQTKNNLWNVVVEYFRLFRYGFLMPMCGEESIGTGMDNLKDQEYFLRAAMADDVALGELSGVDALIDQWQRYSSYFGKLYLHLNKMEQQPQGTMKADATLSFTITEPTLRFVFPLDDETIRQNEIDGSSAACTSLRTLLIGLRLHCQCSIRFSWDDAAGRVTQLEATVDLLSPLLHELGDLELVSLVLGKALITPEYLIGEMQR